jgi:hypothetical protein
MPPGTIRPLTERQRAVMERIDRRVPIKVIAADLGVSETRINQHIRALKNIYGAASMTDLVENYRTAHGLELVVDRAFEDERGAADSPYAKLPLSENEYSKNQIIERPGNGHDWPRNDPGALLISDVLPLAEQAPWLKPGEPRVVPGLLDGEHAVLFRVVAMLLIAIGVLAAVVLTVTAAITLSEAMDGKADLPVEQWDGSA